MNGITKEIASQGSGPPALVVAGGSRLRKVLLNDNAKENS